MAAGPSVSIEWLPEPALIVSVDGDILGCNRAYAHQFAISPQTLVGRRLDALALESPSVVREYLHSCGASEQPVNGSLTLPRGSNAVKCWTYGVQDRGAGGLGRPQVLLLLYPDRQSRELPPTADVRVQLLAEISHGQQIEDSLRRERETLEVTLASIGDGVIVTDPAGRVTFLNAEAEKLTGWPQVEAKGQRFEKVFDIVNSRTSRPVENPVSKVLKSGGIVGLANHTVLIRRDGQRIPLDDSGAPIRMPNGELVGIVVIFRDVTERQRAEEVRAWLAAIIDSSDDAIVSKTLGGIITSWNRAAARLFGYEPREIVGKPITTIVPAELYAEEQELLDRLRRGERIDHFETVRVAKNGRRLDISLTVSPIRDEDGEIVGASKIARDITERKRAEQMLLEADRRKDEFLATLAHELRNPLAPIRTSAELLRRTENLTPALRSIASILDRQVRQMTHLVDDLLDVSRITSGRVHLQREPIELALLLGAVIESHRSALQAQRHEVTFGAPSDPIVVDGDRIRLTQIFSNILHNATKYTPPGGRIHIGLHSAGNEAVVSIRDSGIGIPPEKLGYIFELFAQLDRSYERTEGGLGIGLTLARRLAELHGGRIEARSEGLNRGSEFIVRLPMTESLVQGSEQPSAEMSRQSVGQRVLIADDNHDAAVSLSMLLQAAGHETRIAHDGLQAVEQAEAFRPHVVLLDIGMPKLDGYEVARRIASRPWAGSTLIVAVTGWGQEADRQRSSQAGFHRHLVKPVDPDALLRLLAADRT
jgi:PAS domain S-box-containing protein